MTRRLPSSSPSPRDPQSGSRRNLAPLARACKRELLSRMLSLPDRGVPSSYSAAIRDSSHRTLLRQANVVGLGFGLKETGDEYVGEACLRVYVTRKLPENDLPANQRIPETIAGYHTDVIAIDPPRFQDGDLFPGTRIEHTPGMPGSVGCLVDVKGALGPFVLSACHVLAPGSAAARGNPIHDAHTGKLVAELSDFEPLVPVGEINRFDAAIARVLDPGSISESIPMIGAVGARPMEPLLYQSVRKYGSSTLHTLGVVTDIAADIPFPVGPREYPFDDIIQVTGCGGSFTKGGDSGALVVDAMSARPLGLVIGGDGFHSWLSPITLVLHRFEARIRRGGNPA